MEKKKNLTYEEKIDRIYLAMVGDEDLGIKGIIETQQEHAKWISGQQRLFNKISGGMLVVFMFSSAIAFGVNILLRKLGWI